MIVRVLCLGGLDPGGGAGITADARTLARVEALALPVAMAWTVQNRRGVTAVLPVAQDHWLPALRAALADGPLHAVKLGLLPEPAHLPALAAELRSLPAVPIVLDPVLSATAGGYRPADELARGIVRHLLPLGPVVTPNLPELAALAGAGGPAALLAAGARAVLLKGGHGDGPERVDELHGDGAVRQWRHRALAVGAVHGTGCALAAALAADLGRGHALPEACGRAIALLQRGLQAMGPPAADGLPRPLWLPA